MNAKDYKKLASAKRAEAVKVELPSGGTWKMRELPIQQFMLAGKLPTALATRMAEIAANKDGDKGESILATLSPDELVAIMLFARDALVFCAVEPRISTTPTGDDEIGPEDILPEDFEFLTNWVLTGGKTGESLNTFRSE